MKAEFAGAELDLGAIVWIIEAECARPVYHAHKMVGEPGHRHLVTRCGIAVEAEHRNAGYRSAMPLPPKHAVRFGRPCATCWPELRRQRELWATRPTVRVTAAPVLSLLEGKGDDLAD